MPVQADVKMTPPVSESKDMADTRATDNSSKSSTLLSYLLPVDDDIFGTNCEGEARPPTVAPSSGLCILRSVLLDDPIPN